MTGIRQHVRYARFVLAVGRGLALAAGSMIAHVGHGATLEQGIPRSMMTIMTRYEHIGMRAINFLAMRDWIYRNPTLKRGVDWMSEKIMGVANGEVITLAEAREMVSSVIEAGYTVATGTCPCRRARNELTDDVPINTDMVFGEWAEIYMRNYPGLYHVVDREEACALLEEFDRHGFIHQVYGFNRKAGAAYVMCNCDQSVCIPLLAQKTRGFQAFRRGRSVAVLEMDACKGIEECGVCIARCPFDARSAGDSGKVVLDSEACFGCGVCVATCKGNATSLERKPGAQLLYARPFVK
ncbi:MAG: ATP-binding protein [Candidatus Geothermincolia bacterium]